LRILIARKGYPTNRNLETQVKPSRKKSIP